MKNEHRELGVEELDTVTGGVAVDNTAGFTGAACHQMRVTDKKAGLSVDNKPIGAGMQESSTKATA
jgi:hypothetical protein